MSLAPASQDDEPLLYRGGPLHKEKVILYGRVGEETTVRYEVNEMLGEGSSAKVYRGLDCSQGREVAIKFFLPEVTWDNQGMSVLKKEIDTLQQLSHPNIISLHGFERMGLARFLVMELVTGKTLNDLLKEKRFDEASVIRIANAVCRALHYAHSKGIIHGDINPRNIMLSSFNEIKVTDFGIARVLQKIDTPKAGEAASESMPYASPEQSCGRSIDVPSDIYSLGLCLYELLGGTIPFDDNDLHHGHPDEILPPIKGVSRKLNGIISRCLRSKPEDRFQSAEELMQALEGKEPSPTGGPVVSEKPETPTLNSRTGQKRKRSVLGFVFTALCLVVFGYSVYLAWFSTQPQTDRVAGPPKSNIVPSPASELRQPLDEDRPKTLAPPTPADAPKEDAVSSAMSATAVSDDKEVAEPLPADHPSPQYQKSGAIVGPEKRDEASHPPEAVAETESRDMGAEIIGKDVSPLTKAVATARQATQLMMVEAKKHDSPTYAAKLWKEAEQDREQALEFEKKGKDAAALKAYQRAGSKYMRAEKAGKENIALKGQADAARKAMELMKTEAQAEGAKLYAAESWQAAERAYQEGDEHYRQNDFASAGESYEAASNAFAGARENAKAEKDRLAREKKAKELAEAESARRKIQEERDRADSQQAATDDKESSVQVEDWLITRDESRAEQAPTSVVPAAPETVASRPEEAPEVKDIDALPANLAVSAGQIVSIRDGAEMVMVPAGEYEMGGSIEEGGSTDERPRHRGTINAFYMDKYEVTNARFCAFLNDKGNKLENVATWLSIDPKDPFIEEQNGQFVSRPGYENHPVVGVTWQGATAYAEWAGKRLPTEAEWECACRAGTTTSFSAGDAIGHSDANFSGVSGKDIWDQTAPVGSFASNAWGLHDMHGNVCEWCQDWYGADYYRNSPTDNPIGPSIGFARVVRGGSWDSDSPTDLRSAYRDYHPPEQAAISIGFRCVRDIE